MDRDQEVAQILIVMADNFGESPSEAMLEMLLSELQPFPLEDIKTGLVNLMRTRKYRGFPRLAEVFEAVAGNAEDALMAQAEQQWQRLLDLPTGPGTDKILVGRDPETGEPAFRYRFDDADPIARQIYQSMGGSKAGWTNQNINFLRNQFIKDYVRIASRSKSVSACLDNLRAQQQLS